MDSSTNYPDIIHVGYSKSASSWLRNLFAKNPEIKLIIEPRYFSRIIEGNQIDHEDYLKYFDRPEDDARLLVESDEHILSPIVHPEIDVSVGTFEAIDQVFKELKSVFPDTKIIAISRDPTEVILSKYSQLILQGGALTFEEFFQKLFDPQYNFYENYHYEKVFEIINSYYSPEKTLFLKQREIRDSPEKIVSQIEDFVGVPLSLDLGKKQVNVGFSPWGLKQMRFFNKVFVKNKRNQFHDTETRLIPTFAWYRMQNLIRSLDHKFVKNRSRSKLLSSEMKDTLNKLF